MQVNPQKTQLTALSTRQNIRQLPKMCLQFMGATVSGSPTVRSLEAVFDQGMTLPAHTNDDDQSPLV